MNSSDRSSSRLVELTICTGTACYVMGGSELLLIEESLPASLANKVVISGCPCLGHCRGHAEHRTPCVLVNGKLHGPVDSGDIISLLEEAVHALEQ